MVEACLEFVDAVAQVVEIEALVVVVSVFFFSSAVFLRPEEDFFGEAFVYSVACFGDL